MSTKGRLLIIRSSKNYSVVFMVLQAQPKKQFYINPNPNNKLNHNPETIHNPSHNPNPLPNPSPK